MSSASPKPVSSEDILGQKVVFQPSIIIYFLTLLFSMIVVVSYKYICTRSNTLTLNRCGSGRPNSENVRAVPVFILISL